MKNKLFKTFIVSAIAALSFTSCTTVNKTMKEPNTRVELTKSDFTLSDQVSAEVTVTRILNIDFDRLFVKKSGSTGGLASLAIPVVGGFVADPTQGYAVYELMNANPGYDVVFYPQYETTVSKPILIGWIYRTTTVKATARLGKLNK
jgi:hypothetical protein